MTTYIDKQRLLDELEERIASLAGVAEGSALQARALAFADLKRSIDAGAYDVEGPDYARPIVDEAAPQQDPLEVAADRIVGPGSITDAVRDLPVGDVVSVQTILWRRASEAEKQAAIIRQRHTEMTEALRGLLSAETKAEAPMKSEDDDYERYRRSYKNAGGLDPMTREQYYAATGLRDRNGGR